MTQPLTQPPMTERDPMLARASIVTAAAALLVSCSCPGPSDRDAGAGAGAADAGSPAPQPSASVRVPYAGPKATLHGMVRISGDEPPRTQWVYDPECRGAIATYGALFRKGPEGELADAIVAVTHYVPTYIPPAKEAVEVTIKDCAYSTRSIAMTDGQHIEVRNLDALTSYVPHLDGARAPATVVAVPRGPAVKLFSRGDQRYWLRDQMGRPFMVAHTFHFPYSTTNVTGLDGRYRIEGIPAGKVNVSVLLPMANMKRMTKEGVVLKEGDNTLDLELEFDATRDAPPKLVDEGLAPQPATSTSASAAPAPSAKAITAPAPSAKAP
jgi:hypothetical protein